MKREELLWHLRKHGCVMLREGGIHGGIILPEIDARRFRAIARSTINSPEGSATTSAYHRPRAPDPCFLEMPGMGAVDP
jgi:hypothetical protein